MGGVGSGRRRSLAARALTSRYRCIAIRRWHREGLLRPGLAFTREWREGNAAVAQLQVTPRRDHLLVDLVAWPMMAGAGLNGGIIPVAWTPCQLGGRRPWFLCPQAGCGRRVALLYEHGGYACRHCLRLAYPSQKEPAPDRALRKAMRIGQRLGWEPWVCSAEGHRPGDALEDLSEPTGPAGRLDDPGDGRGGTVFGWHP